MATRPLVALLRQTPASRSVAKVSRIVHRCSHNFIPAGMRTRALRRSENPLGSASFCSSAGKEEGEPAHKLLGLKTRTPTKDELRNAYFLKAKACHPDINNHNPDAKEAFTRISKAYQELLQRVLEREESGESVTDSDDLNAGVSFTCPFLGHDNAPPLPANMKCQIENCPFCAMFGEAGGGSYYEEALDPSQRRPWTKSDKSSLKGKKLPPIKPLFRR